MTADTDDGIPAPSVHSGGRRSSSTSKKFNEEDTTLEHWESLGAAADDDASVDVGKQLPTVAAAAGAGFPVFDEDDDRGLSRTFRMSIIGGSVILMLIIVLCLVFVLPRTDRKNHHTRSTLNLVGGVVHLPGHSRILVAAQDDHIAAACAATRLPEVCRTSLSSSGFPTLTAVVDSAVGISVDQVASVEAQSRNLLASSKNVNLTAAARDCAYLLGRAGEFLRRYLDAGPLAQQSLSDVADSQAWISASLTYENDCRSALSYVNTTKSVALLIPQVDYAINLTSNVLSMLGAYRSDGAQAPWSPPTRSTAFDAVPYDGKSGSGSDWRRIPAVTVAKDGTGQFSSVQAAVDAAPEWSTDWYTIYVKQGVYAETVRIPTEKTKLALFGDGIGRTVITGSRNAQMPGVTTYDSATVAVDGDGFLAVGMTFENTAGPAKHQAVALRVDSDLSVFYNCSFLGFQDTLYVHSLRQFYRECQIEGTVDFIFGNAAAVFQECRVLVRPGLAGVSTSMLTAQGRTDPAEVCGIVFQSCHVDGTPEYLQAFALSPRKHLVYLGRPWKAFSRTVYLECYLGAVVQPAGWLPWRDDFALQTLFYGEYNNSGPGAPAGTRVSWSDQLSHDVAVRFTLSSFLQGDHWLPATNVPFQLSL